MLKIKVCGLKYNILEISKLEIDFMGFIFYPRSPRFIGYNLNLFLPQINKLKVGVFVNENEQTILNKSKEHKLDIIQLHGDESPILCEKLAKNNMTLIKVFHINNSFSFKKTKDYVSLCNYFLFDTKTKYYGGSGKKFVWNKLYDYDLCTYFFLSGGIIMQDIMQITNIFHSHPKMFGIDINSGFEEFPGQKNCALIKHFVKKIKKYK
ncbi:phosphoribosylanthranilate isomerase [Blattabacterium cuenoti]|uniref:phosphoribosylanthranilate isomerase n=1 Tax=Blattabacterium cuenoti TaxID=1653831 RepID=UPI00163CA4F8|nr:phosphoribosylanthranilate isomerase [Blattabacterium cuenoti]